MPSDVKLYRVFIASPGGLQKEREAFKETLTEYNDSDGIDRNVIFLPVGWELTLAGIGRPQALINHDLAKCDYCILVLWDRWGTPPDTAMRYTSGTEEEFNVAWECFKDLARPMRQIVVLFKSVDVRQLSDPGVELQKVLDFKKKLEKDKMLLFDSFDEASTFRRKLRRHLAAWVRDHEAGALGKVTMPRSIAVEPRRSVREESEAPFLPEANDLALQESALARRVAAGDLQALQNYGEILALTQRIPKAREVFEQLLKTPQGESTTEVRAASLRKLASIAREEGSFSEAEELAAKAVTVLRQGDAKTRLNEPGYLIEWALAFTESARYESAEKLIQEALDLRLRQKPVNTAGLAYAYFCQASNLIQQTRPRDAEAPALKAFEIRKSAFGQKPVMILSLNQVGSILRALNRLKEAERCALEALEIGNLNKAAASVRIAATQVVLGVIRREQKRYDEAEALLRQVLATREQEFGDEHTAIASACAELGHVMEDQNRLYEAEGLYRRALMIRTKRYGQDHPSPARSYNALGRLYMAQNAPEEARAFLEKALTTSERWLRHATLIGEIKSNLGALLLQTEPSTATALLQSALTILTDQLGEHHPRTVRVRDLLAQVRRLIGLVAQRSPCHDFPFSSLSLLRQTGAPSFAKQRAAFDGAYR